MTFILLLLGFTANELLQDNYKMKNTNSISKKNFYIAEALSEEADMKLHEHLKQSVYNSYEILLKYIMKYDDYYENIDEKIINRMFKSIFKSQFELSKDKLENIDSYNLRVVENYDVLIEINLEEDSEKEKFYIDVLSIYKDKKIVEKIKTQYIIKYPEYSDFDHNKNLIEKINWVNYKW